MYWDVYTRILRHSMVSNSRAPPRSVAHKDGFVGDAEDMIEKFGLNAPTGFDKQENGDHGSDSKILGTEHGAQSPRCSMDSSSSEGENDSSAEDDEVGESNDEENLDACDDAVDEYGADVTEPATTWMRPVLLRKVDNPKKTKFFRSATETAAFLNVVQSKVSTVRNTAVAVEGWYVSDPGPIPSAILDKSTRGESGKCTREEDVSATTHQQRPMRLHPVRQQESKFRTRPVMLVNCHNPTDRHVYAAGAYAAQALGITEGMISSKRNGPTPYHGWYVRDLDRSGRQLLQARRTSKSSSAGSKTGGKAVLTPIRLVKANDPSKVHVFPSTATAQEFLCYHSQGRWYRCKDSHEPINGWLVQSCTIAEMKAHQRKTNSKAAHDSDQSSDDVDNSASDDPVSCKHRSGTRRTRKRRRVARARSANSNVGKESPSPACTAPPSEFDRFRDLAYATFSPHTRFPLMHPDISALWTLGTLTGETQGLMDLAERLARLSGHEAEHEQPCGRDSAVVEAPPTLAGVPGHSGRLYAGPQNNRGRGRDFIVVKRAMHASKHSNDSAPVPLRDVSAGTWYDVTAMRKETYLARDLDSEDGYWYTARILGLLEYAGSDVGEHDGASDTASGTDEQEAQSQGNKNLLAFISWPAFSDYDPVWVPYDSKYIMLSSVVDEMGLTLVPGDAEAPKISWAYQKMDAS